MKQIELTQGQVAIVDDCDFDMLSKHKWSARQRRSGYWDAITNIRVRKGKQKTTYMSRLILGTPEGMIADHINGNTLDNTRANLRTTTFNQNIQNQKLKRTNSAGYKGVQKRGKRWIARVGNSLYLGRHDTPEDAARAYDKAAKEMYGEFARINFP